MPSSWDKTDRRVAIKATRTGDKPRAAGSERCGPFDSQFSPIALMHQSAFEFIGDAMTGEADGTLARDDDKIGRPWKRGTASAKKLPHLALDPIANDGIADFAADSDPQPGLILVVRPADNDEICRLNLAASAREF
jgi:hypothetical protein